jgi:hypothetical protein
MTTTDKDARAYAAVTLGDGTPLVPHDAQGQDPGAVVAAVLNRLADMKRPRATVLYHCPPSTSAKKGPQP